ncbi:MAG: tRNA (adenosine(37)-N6)-threonylcarbamoyltransferase complex dimerization subunit type 1 TsaB [Coriobacteriia bacterium]|nr:tRNA (adenosine(37)-N6)-threonylcarbamoyltransferase complex dimerization subunit type 1 TsaB [Coriobacteriia bacterium]
MSNFVLAMDTATEEVALALGERSGDRVELVVERDFEAPRAALGRLLPAVQELLARAGLTPADISEVVVGRGPGSFTGVRIGVSSAKGFAHGLGVPLFGVGTLDAIAWRFAGTDGFLGVVGDAMRGEVYPALFRVASGQVERVSNDTVMSPAAAARMWAESVDELLVLAGNGLRKYEDVFCATLGSQVLVADRPMWTPMGAGLLAAFADARVRGVLGDGQPGAMLPVYTRLSDAEENELRARGDVAQTTPGSGVSGPQGVDGP